jgi:hypothetical protein
MLKSLIGRFKPKRVNDPVFGSLVFMRMADPETSYWEGSSIFRPTGRAIEYFIDADEDGPSESQRQFYASVQERYDQLVAVVRPALVRSAEKWFKAGLPLDLGDAFTLSSLSIPRTGAEPLAWELSFQFATNPLLLFTVAMIDWRPGGVRVDG